MLCDKCKQNQATVHVQKNVNGVVENHALCAACAAGMHFTVSMEEVFKGFLSSVFEMAGANTSREEAGNPASCQGCGMSYASFRKAGRFGCAECYKAFRPQVAATMKNVHGATRHEGKLPGRLAADLLYKREIENCKAALRKAIEQERFEEAAGLRDRIRQLETAGAPTMGKGV